MLLCHRYTHVHNVLACGGRTQVAKQAITIMAAQHHRGAAGSFQLRRMFDKVMKDANTTFDERRDGPRFMRAALEFKDDPVDLLYRLTKPQVGCSCGLGLT